MIRPTKLLLAACLIALAFVVTACASSDSSGGSGTTGKVASATPPASGCGSLPLAKPNDPEGLVAKLPPELQKLYQGYRYPVTKSRWSNWKPKHGPPYDVALQWANLGSDFQIQLYRRIQSSLKKNPDIA